MKQTRPRPILPKQPKPYNHYWLAPTNAKPTPHLSHNSEPEDEEEEDDLDQDGFFGDFCLWCGESCTGSAYCSVYCQLDAIRSCVVPKPLPVPIFPSPASYGYPNTVSTYQVNETHGYPFPIIFVSSDPPRPLPEAVACSPKPVISVTSSSSLSCSSSDVSLSVSESSVVPESPIDRIRFSASRPPPSPYIKATVAGPSLSPPIAVRPTGTGGHAALALRQALGISELAPIEPSRRASLPGSSNWLKLLVTGRKDSKPEQLVQSPSSELI